MSIEVHQLIKDHISRWLEENFRNPAGDSIPAALVVFDSIAKLFHFGGYNEAFRDIFGNEQLSNLIRLGMHLEDEGLIPYAVSRFDVPMPDTRWAYALSLQNSRESLLQANISTASISKKDWTPIPSEDCTPGTQLVRFCEKLVEDLADRAKGKYLVLTPYSAFKSEEGLVLVASVEDDLKTSPVTKLLEFFETRGTLLSVYPIILRAEIEQGSSEGYKRLAYLVQHEENGFVETYESHLSKLRDIDSAELEKLKIDEGRINFLQSRVEGKRRLSQEMQAPDPINEVPTAILYGRKTYLLKQMPVLRQDIERVYGDYLKVLTFCFHEGVQQNPSIQLEPTIIDRIIRNVVKNSVSAADSNDKKVSINVVFDIVNRNDQCYLELTIEDDAGGLKKELARYIPRDITPKVWISFCLKHKELISERKGVGLWAISRYTWSSGGKFLLEDVKGTGGEVIGLRCRIVIGLGIDTEKIPGI